MDFFPGESPPEQGVRRFFDCLFIRGVRKMLGNIIVYKSIGTGHFFQSLIEELVGNPVPLQFGFYPGQSVAFFGVMADDSSGIIGIIQKVQIQNPGYTLCPVFLGNTFFNQFVK